MDLLVAKNINKRFGGLQALTALDVAVAEKSIHSVIGPNGAGKTTFFNCVTGFYNPEEGQVIFEGEEIQGMPPDRVADRGISRTYQNIRLFANTSALENVLVGMHRHLHTGWFGAVSRLPKNRREEEAGARMPCAFSSSSIYTASRIGSPRTCPMANSAGSRSPAPWPASHAWCCSTSRRPV